jgi:hypothetical protein
MIVVYYRDYLPPWEEEKDRVLLVSCGYNAINPREQNYRSRVTASLLFHSGMIMFVDMLPKPADALFYSRQLITTLGTQISFSKRDRLPANSALAAIIRSYRTPIRSPRLASLSLVSSSTSIDRYPDRHFCQRKTELSWKTGSKLGQRPNPSLPPGNSIAPQLSTVMSAEQHIHFIPPANHQPQAPLFIYFPGMDGTGKLLRPQIPSLERSFEVWRLSIPVDDLSDWEGMVAKIIESIEGEFSSEIPCRPIYLCGESFGGCLALQLAIAAPHLCDRLILVNPASSFKQQIHLIR